MAQRLVLLSWVLEPEKDKGKMFLMVTRRKWNEKLMQL